MAAGADFFESEDIRATVWDPALFRRLLGYALRYRGRLGLGLLFVLVSTALTLTPPLLLGALVDTVFHAGTPNGFFLRILGEILPALAPGATPVPSQEHLLWLFAALFLTVRVGVFLVDWGNTYLLAGLGQRVIYDIRMELFRHAHGLSLAWFQRNPIGRLVTRVANDVGALEEMFSVALVTIFKDVGLLVGISVILLVFNLRLGAIVLGVLPFMIVATVIFRRASRRSYRRWRAALSRLNAFLAERISGIRIVKLFSLEARNDREQDRLGGDYKRHFLKQRRAWAIFRPIATILSAGGIALVLGFGGALVLRELARPAPAFSIGDLITFLAFAEMFIHPIRDLTEKFDVLQGAMTAAERIFSILDVKSEIVEPESPFDPPALVGRVEFRDVEFEYLPGEPVLRRVSFTVEAGRTVAIVGHTGSGKSTLINLLCRFYDVGGGAVLVDDRDVREYRLTGLRRHIAVVHQDVFLFAGSLIDNIRLGDDSISRERVEAACRAVRAHLFIELLPSGYDTELEEGGKTLSAGERQLLSFARALITEPSILVLDEATASVDTHTEELIQAAMLQLTKGRTSLVIAHRLSTIRRADRILVMEGGRLVESGTHEELLARRGSYHRLYRMQFAESPDLNPPASGSARRPR